MLPSSKRLKILEEYLFCFKLKPMVINKDHQHQRIVFPIDTVFLTQTIGKLDDTELLSSSI
jgi:hypothetical protein